VTISSLQIGQIILALAAAAAEAREVSPWSTEIREVRSWLSKDGGVETPEPNERVLAEGERHRFWACGF
jgi:hypothetical protein